MRRFLASRRYFDALLGCPFKLPALLAAFVVLTALMFVS